MSDRTTYPPRALDRWMIATRSIGSEVVAGLADLFSLAPVWLRSIVLGDQRAVRLEIRDDHVHARLVDPLRPATSDVANATERDDRQLRKAAVRRPVILEVSPERVLRCEVDIPNAAARKPETALRYGLSRWTPFEWNEVHVGWQRMESKGEVTRLKLALVPRSVTNPLLEQAQQAGFAVDALHLGDDHTAVVWIRSEMQKRLRRALAIDLLLAVLAAGLVIALVWLHLENAEAERERLQGEIKSAIVEVRAGERLAAEVAGLERMRAQIRTARQDFPSVSAVFNDLAQALPADAQIEELAWSGHSGRLVVRQPIGSASTLQLPAATTLSVAKVVMDRTSRPDALMSIWELTVRPETAP
ncbi:hypothetical protein GGR25_001070 [Kaistia hirudinis]|uniref:General secretion pathway protein GspL n=1 Tax=Kaistia hirudinis TaxID=1293440 RepID=A0A840AMB4_9HYPH|nr:hypothetical protein [Kaistia hirudinis]MBB3930031.1 hypothetical protein [Kaistia hirudinis]